MENLKRRPKLIEAFIPVFFLIGLLTMNVIYFDDTLEGANQIALLLAAAIAAIIATYLGVDWKNVRNGIVKSIGSAMPSILILLIIGALSGTWLISGVVPAMIYYGLDILSPPIFLFAAVVVSGIVSLATGSSWSTIATIGVALLGIGSALGISEGLVAGAIISGAYFGDKMSPLSDTTNLAPAMAGTDLFTHIKYMMYTTVPTMCITLIIFLVIGFNYDFDKTTNNVEAVRTAIMDTFYISPLLFLVPVILIIIIIKKVPPIPALLAGTLLGAIFAIIFQPDIIKQVAGKTDNFFVGSYMASIKAMYGKVSIITSDLRVNELFSTSGMAGMLNTIWLIMTAMVFGGVMESAGLLIRITQAILKFVRSTGSLVASTAVSCIFFNITASDQYISIVVPGRMFSKTYREKGYKPELLSRTLEDAGTVTSVLIPWNTGGATQAKVLGVSTMTYLPYCFFNIISPMMSVFYVYMNIKIRRFKNGDEEQSNENEIKAV